MNAKFWPIFSYFVANLCPFWCTPTGLNNAAVYQNGENSGFLGVGGGRVSKLPKYMLNILKPIFLVLKWTYFRRNHIQDFMSFGKMALIRAQIVILN